ncbi:MAG: GIY-YIG nuclease family protein, partial [Myxococcota bacterium]|nr:GIY-YIG nuclease family protein [Myxococcota bacterium]
MPAILTLHELLKAKDPTFDPKNCKLHFATTSGRNPLHVFFEGGFEKWQEDQGQKNFGRKFVVSVIQQHRWIWLFAGVWRVLHVGPRKPRGFLYQTEPVDAFDPLVGRVLVEYAKPFRNSYPNAETCIDEMHVVEVLSERMAFRDFPGIGSVTLSFDDLRLVVEQGLPGWKSPLSSFGGIYLIADGETGKLYVGQAPG